MFEERKNFLPIKNPGGSESTPKMFNIAADKPAVPAEESFEDLNLGLEETASDEHKTLPPPEPAKPIVPEIKLGVPPDEQNIAKALLEEIERQSLKETKGFSSGGEKIRFVLPDAAGEPERVKRLMDLANMMIRMAENRRKRSEKK